MKKAGKRKTMKQQLTVLIALAISSMIILLFLLDSYLVFNYSKKVREDLETEFEQLSEGFEKAMSDVDSTLSNFYFNSPDFETICTTKDSVTTYSAAYDLYELLKGTRVRGDAFCGFILSYDGGEQFLYELSDKLTFAEKESLISKLRNNLIAGIDQNEWFLVQTAEKEYFIKFYQKQYGCFMGVLSLSDYFLSSLPYDSQYTFLWEENFIDKQKKEFEIIKSDDDYNYILETYLGNTNLKALLSVKKSLTFYIRIDYIVLLFFSGLILILILKLMLYIKKEMNDSLGELKEEIQLIRDNKWDLDVARHSGFQEFEEVNEMFKEMLSEIRQLKITSYEEKLKKQKAELTYLYLQIRPHFYLNCLKTVNALLKENRNEDIEKLIIEISVHMRYLLKVEREISTLAEEVDYAKNYLNLQKSLFEKEIICDWNISDTLLHAKVPLLLIQTFFENSFKYYKPQNEGDSLILKVKAIKLSAEEGDYIDLSIRDNGGGYPQEVLDYLNDFKDGVEGVGINNLKNRCQILYSGKAEFNFYNSGGAVSEIVLPLMEELG